MLNYGADAIFQVGSNLNDKDIDQMIKEGEEKSNKMAVEAQEKIGEKFNMVDFEMNTVS